ncbi:MAG: serine/threonine protein kinase [Cyanobacteria bacterium TGS_CYA1]|nr:serine/threonine protein kinase [Cyanobacteria bacterium TGS_CYA1]
MRLPRSTHPYMVMELLDGKGLDKLIKERGSLEYKVAISIFKQICNGLSAAHLQNIIHRDLKPSNIVLLEAKKGWLVKILDFGIAQIETDQKLTRTGAVLGSPSYMSPEQIDGLAVDARCDIYSFGCLMFETLTGRVPFEGKTSLETLAMHKNALPEELALSTAKIPPLLVELILQCLEKEPDKRPENMAQIQLLLDQITNEEIDHVGNDAKIDANDSDRNTQQVKPSKSVAMWYFVVPVIFFAVLVCIYFALQISNTSKETALNKSLPPAEISFEQNKLPARLGTNRSKFKATGDPLVGLQVTGGEDIEDQDLQALTFEKVETLKIHSRELTGEGLKYLKNLNIKTLELKNTNIAPENLKYLSGLPVLTDLILHSPYLNDAALEEISRIKSLVNLTFDAGTFTRTGFSSLLKLPNLSSITLINLGVTDKDLEPLSQIKSLTVVRIIDCVNIGADIGVIIARLPKLDTVFINRPLSKASYAAFARTKMRAFNLKNRLITQEEFQNICRVKTLWRIGFIHARVSDDNYDELLKLPKLRRMEISRTDHISDSLISTLARSHVQSLDISFSGLRQDQLEKLIADKFLDEIYCSEMKQIGDKQLEEFRKRFEARHHKPLRLIKNAM